jgi:DNA (cytosine-5)-methyltransferase 1
MNVVSLFTGIGGFDLAFQNAGGGIVMQCELDRYCQAVLKRHWPKAPLVSDIRTLKKDKIPNADIWTAGFPCQDVSLARGNHGRDGLKGVHTSLFFRLMDLVEAKTPKIILLENVAGLLNSHKGSDFAVILNELTSRGYAVTWRVMNARYFGAPQSRSRVFICAWQNDYRRSLTSLYEEHPSEKPGNERLGFMTPMKDSYTGAIVPEVAYCVSATSGRHTGLDWSRSYISYLDKVRRPTPTESERLQGYPTDWTIPHAEFAAPSRGLDSERYRAIGNAVAVPVVQWIVNRIKSSCASNTKANRLSFADYVSAWAPDLTNGMNLIDFRSVMSGVERGQYSYRWKTGGCAWDNIVIEGCASPAPSKIIHSKFIDVLDRSVPDLRYFLTPNAATGIVRRADIVGRNLFPPMRKALERLIASQNDGPMSSAIRNDGDTQCQVQHSSV